MLPDALSRLADDFSADWAEDTKDAQVTAVVMGPRVKDDTDAHTQNARDLRRAILEECSAAGVAVEPEHPKLLAVTRKHLGGRPNLCLHEKKLVDGCDVLIIVAAGAGPLVELGLFAEHENLRMKSVLVLLDRDFMKCASFINQGPRLSYLRNKARVLDVDYGGQVAKILGHVRELLQEAKETKVARKL